MLIEIDPLRYFNVRVRFWLMDVDRLDLLEIEKRVKLHGRLLLQIGPGRRDIGEHDWSFGQRGTKDVEHFDGALVPTMLFDLVVAR